MPTIGNCWAANTWTTDAWAADTWASDAPPPDDPHLVLTPATVIVNAVLDGAFPSPREVAISNSGGGSISPTLGDVTYLDGSGWLDPTPDVTGDVLTVSFDTTGLIVGTYEATIEIESVGADNAPTVLVRLVVYVPSTDTGISFWSAGSAGGGASFRAAGVEGDGVWETGDGEVKSEPGEWG